MGALIRLEPGAFFCHFPSGAVAPPGDRKCGRESQSGARRLRSVKIMKKKHDLRQSGGVFATWGRHKKSARMRQLNRVLHEVDDHAYAAKPVAVAAVLDSTQSLLDGSSARPSHSVRDNVNDNVNDDNDFVVITDQLDADDSVPDLTLDPELHPVEEVVHDSAFR